jgi:hypothetical protein
MVAGGLRGTALGAGTLGLGFKLNFKLTEIVGKELGRFTVLGVKNYLVRRTPENSPSTSLL